MNPILKAFPGNPANEAFVAKRNDTFLRSIIGYQEDGTPYDFAGHTFRMHVRKHIDDDVILIDMDNTSFTITQDAAGLAAGKQNQVDIKHAPASMNVATGKWTYDLEMTDAAANVQTIMEGSFTVTKDRTHDPVI